MQEYRGELRALEAAIEELKKKEEFLPYSSRYTNVIAQCRQLLLDNDYAVIKKPKSAKHIKNIKGLVDLYYSLLVRLTTITPYRNDAKDLTTAKRLVKSVQDSTGFDYDNALIRAINIVEGLFKYRKMLNLETHVLTSFSVFGQGKLAWITERIVTLINKELYDETRLMARADAETEAYVKKKNIVFGWDDLESISEKIRRDNGKKR